MSAQNNGGPAFPAPDDFKRDSGMTLRDYFAASVSGNDLAGVKVLADAEALAGRPRPESYPNGLDSLRFNAEIEAALRYMFADAMLAERAK